MLRSHNDYSRYRSDAKELAKIIPGNPDCWRIVDYANSEQKFKTQYTFEALSSAEMRIVGYPLCYNVLSPIVHFVLVNGLRGVRGMKNWLHLEGRKMSNKKILRCLECKGFYPCPENWAGLVLCNECNSANKADVKRNHESLLRPCRYR